MAAAKKNNYHDEQNNLNTLKMREVVAALPPFCKQFFRGIQEYTSSRTRLAYAYDLRVFFEFLHSSNPALHEMEIKDFPPGGHGSDYKGRYRRIHGIYYIL